MHGAGVLLGAADGDVLGSKQKPHVKSHKPGNTPVGVNSASQNSVRDAQYSGEGSVQGAEGPVPGAQGSVPGAKGSVPCG